MKILITGVGCVGKSFLREKIATNFPDHVIAIDMDYEKEIPKVKDKVLLIESVHGLEDDSINYDKILYMQYPYNHSLMWFKRAWIWFATGIVNLSIPKEKAKKYSVFNIPIIIKILFRNLLFRNKWVDDDLKLIQRKFSDKAKVASSIDKGYKFISSWITNHNYANNRLNINSNNMP